MSWCWWWHCVGVDALSGCVSWWLCRCVDVQLMCWRVDVYWRVLTCWRVDVLNALMLMMCWCWRTVLMMMSDLLCWWLCWWLCWCVDVLVCKWVDVDDVLVLTHCMDVLMCRCVVCVDDCVDVLMCWCVDVFWRVLTCWRVDVLNALMLMMCWCWRTVLMIVSICCVDDCVDV
jgi:hypothetical protein